MRPDDRDLDDEIRGHLALCVKERVDRGEDPEAARLAALREFGYIADVRESMRRVWYTRWFDALTSLGREMRIGVRSLRRAKRADAPDLRWSPHPAPVPGVPQGAARLAPGAAPDGLRWWLLHP